MAKVLDLDFLDSEEDEPCTHFCRPTLWDPAELLLLPPLDPTASGPLGLPYPADMPAEVVMAAHKHWSIERACYVNWRDDATLEYTRFAIFMAHESRPLRDIALRLLGRVCTDDEPNNAGMRTLPRSCRADRAGAPPRCRAKPFRGPGDAKGRSPPEVARADAGT
jgi:hypothetical protein